MKIDYNPKTNGYETIYQGEKFVGATRMAVIYQVLRTIIWPE